METEQLQEWSGASSKETWKPMQTTSQAVLGCGGHRSWSTSASTSVSHWLSVFPREHQFSCTSQGPRQGALRVCQHRRSRCLSPGVSHIDGANTKRKLGCLLPKAQKYVPINTKVSCFCPQSSDLPCGFLK